MASQIDYIKEILNQNLLWTSDTIELPRINLDKILSVKKEWLEELMEDLEGKGFPKSFRKPDLQCEDTFIIFNDAKHFNKYRSFTFRSELYDDFDKIKVDHYRSFCRSNEKKCLSAASAGELWTNQSAEKYFGSSQDNGDLGLSGSAAWKLRAYEDYMWDLIAYEYDLKVIYVSIYDVIMINNQLTPIEKMTLSQNEESTKYLWNYLKRLLGR